MSRKEVPAVPLWWLAVFGSAIVGLLLFVAIVDHARRRDIPIAPAIPPVAAPDRGPHLTTFDAIGVIVLSGAGLAFLVFTVAVYMVPTGIAWQREHPHLSSIAVINVMLGWTLIGYAVALAWAFLPVEKGGE